MKAAINKSYDNDREHPRFPTSIWFNTPVLKKAVFKK